MKHLLDTHAFLWWIGDDPALSRRARAALADPGNTFLLSMASAWEMAIKISLGKLELDANLERFLPEQMSANGFSMLPIDLRHVSRAARLPFHHRDPFDRLIVAQALVEEVPVVTADPAFTAYGVRRVW